MRGNVGGGGGFFLGYMLAKNPGVALVLAALIGVGAIGYQGAVQLDKPDREPIVTQIVDHSLQTCTNAAKDGALYEMDLKDGLMTVWSSQLEGFKQTHGNVTICEDAALNDFVLPYDYNEVGTNYKGEYRVMGVLYTKADGSQALVVKPQTNERAPNSIDDRPDRALSMGKVLEALDDVPANVYKHTLPDGTTVSAFLQHDGVTQAEGSSKIHDNDGKGWADQEKMNEILEHYKFAWPAGQKIAAKTYQMNLSLS